MIPRVNKMPYKRKSNFKSKSSAKKGSWKKSAVVKAKRANFVKAVKSIVMRTSEPKSTRYAHAKVELYHNTMGNTFFINSGPFCMPSQGTGDTQRIGDQINVSGFRLRLLLGQKADRPNVTFRYAVVKVPKASSYTYGSWFVAATNNILLDDFNTDFVKVLKTGVWKPHNGQMSDATDEFTFTKKLWIPYRRLVRFGPADAVTTHNDGDIYLMIGAYDAYGTLSTDNIAYVQCMSEVFYKDP